MDCPFCAEALPDLAAPRCAQCGEKLPRLTPAVLRWEADHVVVVEPGVMPAGVCFRCAAVGYTKPVRLFGAAVDVPTCAACARLPTTRATLTIAALLVTAALFCGGGALLPAHALDELSMALTVAAALAVPTWLLYDRRRHVRPALRDGQRALVLPDLPAVRRALERGST